MKRFLFILSLAVSMTAFNYSFAQTGQPVQRSFGYGQKTQSTIIQQHPAKPVNSFKPAQPVKPMHPVSPEHPMLKK